MYLNPRVAKIDIKHELARSLHKKTSDIQIRSDVRYKESECSIVPSDSVR
jgi:hypothetical protein